MIRPSLTPRPSWREVEVMGGTVRLQAKLQAGAAHRQAGQGDKEAERKMIFFMLCSYVLLIPIKLFTCISFCVAIRFQLTKQ